MDVELDDWEVLDDSDSLHTSTYLDGIEPDSEDIIRSDHFSLHSQNHLQHVTVQTNSNNPTLIDPVSDSDEIEIASKQVSCDESLSDSDQIESNTGAYVDEKFVDEKLVDEKLVGEKLEGSGEMIEEGRNEGSDEDVLVGNMKAEGEERKRVVVWWKLPLDLLKYCLFKASPVWTLSAAAAMMGVVILGRRMYKMKQKTRILQLKVAVDDKKASQVMSRAERLNEAFSVVKRAPIIRPSLPAAGNAHWPMVALR